MLLFCFALLVQVWDSSSGRELLNFAGHNKDVFSCSFSPDDRNVLSCSADNTIKVLKLKLNSVFAYILFNGQKSF